MLLSSCSSNYTCPTRVPFTGTTYGDLVEYTGNQNIQYDSCAKPKPIIDWDSIMNSFASNPTPTANTINLSNRTEH